MYFKLSQSLLDRSRHCELRSSEAIQNRHNPCLDCFPLSRQGSYPVATIPTGSTCQNRRREAQPRTNLGDYWDNLIARHPDLITQITNVISSRL